MSAVAAASLHADEPAIQNFTAQPVINYGSWSNSTLPEDGKLRRSATDSKGGIGDLTALDLSSLKESSPALTLVIDPANKAKTLRVRFADQPGSSAEFIYSLEQQPTGQSVTLLPKDAASLARPNGIDEKKGAPDLAKIQQWQVSGNWSADAVRVIVERIGFVSATPEMTVQRESLTSRLAEEAAAAQAAKAKVLASITHRAESPELRRVYSVAPDILALEVLAGKRLMFPTVPYEAHPGDEIKLDGVEALVDINGELKMEKEHRNLWRKANGQERRIGQIVGGRDGKLFLRRCEELAGDPLELLTVDDASSYTINGRAPLQVYRKSKVEDSLLPNSEKIYLHRIYLKLASPLEEGQTVDLGFPGLNLREASATYKHDTASGWSEALHASHVGYRPNDPFKRAYLSLWLGSGGAYTYAPEIAKSFEVLNVKTGKVAFSGPITLALAADAVEKMKNEKNYSSTAVFSMDFSKLTEPAEYVVRVPGVGVSSPFNIADDAWTNAFCTAMLGFLHNRSGIALEKPWSDFDRARDFHPADGIKVYRSEATWAEALSYTGAGDWFTPLVKGRTEETLPDAWGGYHNAGDFDRSYHDMWATYLILELQDLFPKKFSSQPLRLPPSESKNSTPDILDEALWNVDCFRRLQRADGGVGGGIESSAHPRGGEYSVNDSLALMAYAPDPASSSTYAAVAAKAARLLKPSDAARSKLFAESAIRAFAWAEANRDKWVARTDLTPDQHRNLSAFRASAAAELFRLTGEGGYDELYRKINPLAQSDGNPDAPEAQDALFAYAIIPEGQGDEDLKKRIIEAFRKQADIALAFAEGNAFGLTTNIPGLPEMGPVGYFSVPHMITQTLPRAHFLTQEEKYLAGTLQAANFGAGANPGNITFTSGLGHNSPRHVLHFDSRMQGTDAPSGISIYGQSDPAAGFGFNEWVHTWHLQQTVPPSRSWPATEAHVDMFMWPMMSEFTIKQNIGPVSYFYGYLAGRDF